MELQLEEPVMAATEDEVAAQAAAKTSSVRSFTRKRPVRKPSPEDIERERVEIDPPVTCACCGGSRLSKLGEDVTETLEASRRRRSMQRRAASTVLICSRRSLFDKYGMHRPLNRQSIRFKCEGLELSTSTLAD
ncbi:hypothetical protein FB004_1333 [Sinorhizobium medicae]|nr:hypothetical protein FB004_1333 [Sinorhizobium medicae]